MKDAVILNCRRLPARLDVNDMACLLGVQPHDVAVLIRAKLVKPLGTPAPNASKYFATAEVLQLMQDRGWLEKITRSIALHWRARNHRQTTHRDLNDAA